MADELGRFRVLNSKPVNLDGFSVPDAALGLVAMSSPHDPSPSLTIQWGDGGPRVTELDGKDIAEFDVIDEFIARYGIDLAVADEAMALDDETLARMVVDINVPRAEVVRLIGGTTPAKLARVVALLSPVEMQMAMVKMRARRTPSNQAHVTNQLDDPLLIAADAASAVAYGFREVETTVPVLGDAPSNAVALLIGSQVGAPGAMAQCSIEEALELRLGLRGLTSYAETISIYGTEQVFTDGDDTPFSKAILTSAYASRGLKMRVTSGGGAEVLMGAAQMCSILYLESRCVSLARALGSQGVQNGGIDGVGVVASVPEGMKELLAENLMVMLRDLESCAGNDNLISESDIRRSAHTLPVLLAGADFIFSGFGSIPRYDNAFALSNFNADDMDDFLVLQRDWGADGGLRTVSPQHLETVRRRAAKAVQAVYRDLGLADYDDARVEQVVAANGSRDLPAGHPKMVAEAAASIEARQLTVFDVIASLHRTGFAEEAEAITTLTRERLRGDQLQTSAIFDEQFRVLSKITDPNDYRGPATGYAITDARRAEIDGIRQARSGAELTVDQEHHRGHVLVTEVEPAQQGSDPREVCVGLSPAWGRSVWLTLCGLTVGEVLRQIAAGLEEEGCIARTVRVRSTIDTGLIGLTAARLSGSGIGIGLQGKGTALIHRRDLAPLANLELFSVAPLLTAKMYRELGKNAARHAKGMAPVPIFTGGTDESISARYHARAVALVALEREACEPGRPPVTVKVGNP
ncbi:propanediol/glycerol family dehydratase large subunit [Mycolicibacterium parafortuitum]|uniref:Glycerol dehydratase large subunit [Hyphomicrobium sp. MC1] n=1 Tax=Mycolicibacterium parafortuitum TaxID=39692 RepID=A0A375YCG6_MYCPF|nr:propanediol/glycerol family dehydratase large subunit [Mycolicibacterium parafortuitum]ORB30802.1 propanediol dehydratase [Mycolicibacterium parafortuitum]SRX78769.1 glycerol dehydratase large subunit [Hyphomicrobium sp. MC1] [Mycolicibacterium parafortuitum]